MTKALNFTESKIRRALAAIRKTGLRVVATTIAPDGSLTLHHEGASATVVPADTPRSKWDDGDE
jgi:hypothetical protein